MASYIQIPNNLCDSAIKIVSAKYKAEDFNRYTQTIITKAQLSSMQKSIQTLSVERDTLSSDFEVLSSDFDVLSSDYSTLSVDYQTLSNSYNELSIDNLYKSDRIDSLLQTLQNLTDQLNALSDTVQEYVNNDVVTLNNNDETEKSYTVDMTTITSVENTENDEPTVKVWPNGEKTEELRKILFNDDNISYSDPFTYVIPENHELLTEYGISKIQRQFIDEDNIQTTVTFSNENKLVINGIRTDNHGGTFIKYKKVPYSFGYFSQLWTNDFTNVVNAETIININTYYDDMTEKTWIILVLNNGKLTFIKRHFLKD